MPAANSRTAEIQEIDAFLAEPKTLAPRLPEWVTHRREWNRCQWPVADATGAYRRDTAVTFSFRMGMRQNPQIRLLLLGKAIYGIDLDPDTTVKSNRPTAMALGLPGVIRGAHWHRWEDNRQFWLDVRDTEEIPNRRPAPHITRLPQALFALAAATNIALDPPQRAFDVPPQSSMF